MSVTPGKLIPYLTAEKIEQLNRKLGEAITRDYRAILGPDEELFVVVTLKGALFFAADLLRRLDVPARLDFVRLASYGRETKSSGAVRILKDVETPPQGMHVLILDEIVDTGYTLQFLTERIKSAGPKSLRVCALLSKPSRREVDVKVDYLGTEVEDKFLLGYGLDFDEKYRNMRDICYLEP
jgi:hypoxanthine phosphoribosyltransferase